MSCSDKLICENLAPDTDNSLLFNNHDVCELARKYGTPLYVMDADRIRNRCREIKSAVLEAFGPGSFVAYASKAASFKEMYRIINDENMYTDVVSCGEMATAQSAGFPLERAFFHSCNKTDEDIETGVLKKVGYFVVDNIEELDVLNSVCERHNCTQKVLIRLTPGIDPHTFAAVATGNVDSKFGFGITTGMAEKAVEKALCLKHIKLCGFHCHMGSQIFDTSVLEDAAEIMLDFIAYVGDKYGFKTSLLDMGGGFAVRYTADQKCPDVKKQINSLATCIKSKCAELGIQMPDVCFEPGRFIVADAGLTVYTVGSVKEIPGFKTYVSVDGGMTDNVRYAMYGSEYTVVYPRDVQCKCNMKCTLVGRCCESGDIIQPDIMLPETIKRGDFVAVLTTGAYNYSMASNYNRIPRPAVVMLEGNSSKIAVRRETESDLISLDT